MNRRALHYVFKIGDRSIAIHFFKRILGMKVLRHEEFSEGCQAYCNGPYDGKWSKTMIGYGPEDNHFVMELTYNYGVGSYKMGNDFQYISIDCPQAYENIKAGLWPVSSISPECAHIDAPGGYRFVVNNRKASGDPVRMVALSVSDMKRSLDYWSGLCGMTIVSRGDRDALLHFGPDQCQLKLIAIDQPINHASAFGRIAFSCPRTQLSDLQKLMDEKKQTILKRLISLDTPGKATVEVVILADPDAHEICFVGDEAFRELSQVDPKADELITEAIRADKSDEWFTKHGGKATQ